jgi:hypothetical protein
VKVKLYLCLTKHHAMKTYWGSRGIASRVLNLGTRWMRVVSFTLRPFYPQWKSLWYPLDRGLGEPQSRSGCGGEKKKIPSPRRESNPRTLIVQPVDVLICSLPISMTTRFRDSNRSLTPQTPNRFSNACQDTDVCLLSWSAIKVSCVLLINV